MSIRGEAGSATVWAVGWMGVCLGVTWLVVTLAVAVARQHQVDGAADLVSLSAAAERQRGGEPCALATRVALANKVSLAGCSVEGTDVVVQVTDTLQLPLGLTVSVTSSARAGPGDTGPQVG